MAEVEKIEAKSATEAVKETEAKVRELIAKKQADKAKKHAERIEKHPKLGKAINWIDDNKIKIVAGVATGGVSFAAGWFGHKFLAKDNSLPAEVVDVTNETTEEVPFNMEA